MNEIKITREMEIGSRTHMIVKAGKYYAYIAYDHSHHQVKAPNYYGDKRGSWFSSGRSDDAIDYVADWVSYTTARRRFLESTEFLTG